MNAGQERQFRHRDLEHEEGKKRMAINPSLYRAITERLGEATVRKEGEPMVAHYEQGSSPGPPALKITQFGESYCVQCPFCASETRCLTINHQYGKYDQQTGWRYLHLAKCFRKNCLANPVLRQKLAEVLLGMVNRDRRKQGKQILLAAPETVAQGNAGKEGMQIEEPATCEDNLNLE